MTTHWTTRCIGAAILLLATVAGTAVSAAAQSTNGDQTPTLRYPELSCFLGHEGTLTVLVKQDAHGHPMRVFIKKSSGYHNLDRAAVHWAYRLALPVNQAKASRNATTSWVKIPVVFTLRKHRNPTFWGPDASQIRYVPSGHPLLYKSVGEAFSAVLAKYKLQASDMHGLTVPDIRDPGPHHELWAFIDMNTPKAMVVHMVRDPDAKRPTVAVSALCADGQEACAWTMKSLIRGPGFVYCPKTGAKTDVTWRQ